MWACGVLFVRLLTLKDIFKEMDTIVLDINNLEYLTRPIFSVLGTPRYNSNQDFKGLRGFPLYKAKVREVFGKKEL